MNESIRDFGTSSIESWLMEEGLVSKDTKNEIGVD